MLSSGRKFLGFSFRTTVFKTVNIHTHTHTPKTTSSKKCSWYLKCYSSELNHTWYVEEARKREWSYTNGGICRACLSIISAKTESDWQRYTRKLSAETENRGKSIFLFFVMVISLPQEISNTFLCYWKASNSSFLFTFNTCYCKDLQEVFKSRLAAMPVGFLCLVSWPSGALTGNRVWFVFNSKHRNLWRNGF